LASKRARTSFDLAVRVLLDVVRDLAALALQRALLRLELRRRLDLLADGGLADGSLELVDLVRVVSHKRERWPCPARR